MKIYIFLFFLLIGCASQQIPFQKVDNGIGYSVEEKSPSHFLVKLNLPGNLQQSSINRYTARAVGEECKQKGYLYFDYLVPVNGASEGFCFKENKRKAFAITFTDTGLTSTPPQFVVESLNQKSITYLQLNDQVLKVDGKDIKSVSDMKRIAFANEGKTNPTLKLEIVRQSKIITISEPLANTTNAAYGPDDLNALMKKYY